MTDSPRSAMLRVEADLRIDVDGQRASLVGEGQRLTFTAEAPAQLIASFRNTPLPADFVGLKGVRAVGRVADALGEQGLEFHVAGPDGDVVHLGSGAHSWWGRAVVGSSRISVDSVRAVRFLAWPTLRRVLLPAAATLSLAAAGAVFARGRIRARQPLESAD